MFILWSEIRVKSDIVMIVMQTKLWDYRMVRGVLGFKKSSGGAVRIEFEI